MGFSKSVENTVDCSFVALQNGDNLGFTRNRRIDRLGIGCLFKTCQKFVEVIDAMLDWNFQS